MVTAPDDLRTELGSLTTRALIAKCAAFATPPHVLLSERVLISRCGRWHVGLPTLTPR